MYTHREKYTLLILALLTLLVTAHKCSINALISCVFLKVLKNVIFHDLDGIRKMQTHDHRQAVHRERGEIINCIIQDTHQQWIKKVLFKCTKTTTSLWKAKKPSFSHVGSKSHWYQWKKGQLFEYIYFEIYLSKIAGES